MFNSSFLFLVIFVSITFPKGSNIIFKKTKTKDPQFNVKEFVEWFQQLPKNTNTLRIFRRDGFYQIYGDFVSNIATEFLKSAQTISWVGEKDEEGSDQHELVPCVSIKPKVDKTKKESLMCESIIHDYLTRKGKNVEIYERDSDGSWNVSNKASPGNTSGLEGCIDVNTNTTQSYLMSVYVGKDKTPKTKHIKLGLARQLYFIYVYVCVDVVCIKTLGIGLCDSNSLRMEIAEMLDNKHYTNIQALLVGKGVKEAIVQSNASKQYWREMEHLENILRRSQVGIADSTGRWPSLKDQRQLELTVETLANDRSKKRLMSLLVNKNLGLIAINALINQWDLYINNVNHGQFDIVEYKATSFMKLDGAAIHALNLFPSITDS
ncbi:hypothetical protein RFI_14436 [Reticulomyxa filosa]|uniref:Uncharacterized protein n=1 Tax=Reticulomyxa filosa TaxID=46433 RepID=X6NA24_RETFI|nr:hypothetical protein RFI_14436 [Reticulomyxa filosa]|eukprot:ETO22758.1 hypothetical protein RFI_14436 [Reticulomyxa filosa]